ncbi:hypothetical protein [Actinomadura rugatobispora]|uniref:Uncharacterized protein n=1 Tax=Actinomadura rugatobispora TaxID=1994 RepID=A0ABW0ZUI5_9ACTN|nr:hypothetical protein GCM10010200_023260 [Actinomadura rugatobispora]
MAKPRSRIVMTVAWWAWMPLAAWLFWALLHTVFGGVGTWEQWWRLTVVRSWWLPGGDLGHPTFLFWLWVAIGLIGTAVIMGGGLEDLYVDTVPGGVPAAVAAGVAAAVVLAYPLPVALWDNDKDAGRHYGTGTVFHDTKGTAPPSSLGYLLDGARPATADCDARGLHDVPSCVKHDQLEGIRSFEGRTSSFASADAMMEHAASPAPKVDAWEPSITYFYGSAPGQMGVWSAILDGSGKATPAYGIATWDGKTNNVQVGCRFNVGPDNRFDRAFAGQRGNSLRNLLAEKYPDYRYDDSDVWGYCKGSRPVIVVAVSRQKAIGHRTVDTAAGVLILEGGPKGVAHRHQADVKAGELPGPVYPDSLVERQTDATAWAAGRKWKQRASFGFKPTSDDVQAGNTSEYLLRGPDRRLYFVTPLSPNASKSQAFIAYAVTPADVVSSGRLNRMDVYVLPDGDRRVANLNTLVGQATNAVRSTDPTFLNTKGELEEFTPLGGDMWRVFGVRRGITEFYVDLSATGRTAPKTVAVAGTPPAGRAPAPASGASPCAKQPRQMNEREIADCMTALAEELRDRDRP